MKTSLCSLLLMVCWISLPIRLFSSDESATFFRGLNLNGPPVVIDGNLWDGQEATWYQSNDKAFENQKVPLVPNTDPERARMIRSSRWGGNQIVISNLPDAEFTFFLYVWEDNRSETFSIFLNDRMAEKNFQSGDAGVWKRLGPWFVTPHQGNVVLTSRGGAANFSGIEIWKGRHDGGESTIPEEHLAFFEKRIRPLLVEKCYACHSQDADEVQGEFLADSRSSIRRGGSLGPGIVPYDPKQSVVIQRVMTRDEDERMPPDEPLSNDEIGDLMLWVEMGAPDPRSKATAYAGKKIDVESALNFWSFRPIEVSVPPVVKKSEWPINAIDHYVLEKLEEVGLTPADDADKRAWLRRVSYDLIGLPPTPAEVSAFLADTSDNAWENVVNRLLDSPHYGERWGRHWLDVVRYADTAGDNSDYPVPQAYRYRNWVIEALNRDLSYDEFIRDQLAGDLRGGENELQRQQRIIATGYIAIARRFGSRVSDYPQHLTIEDTLDNLGKAFLGISLACARCHDHKFDPVTTRDYYGLYGIFDSTRYPWPGIELDKKQRDFVPLVPHEKLPELVAQQMQHNERLQQAQKAADDLEKEWKALKDEPREKKKAEWDEAKKLLDKLRETPDFYETAYAVVDAQIRRESRIQIKGDPAKEGDLVQRRFLTVFGAPSVDENHPESGRRELAEWILADWNPLTARVMVNRIWQNHFGKGLVPTPNDFGRQGKPPTHPELLDYLAHTFRQQGWSIKQMHRLIVLSRTYRQSTLRPERAVDIDPNNDLLAGFPSRRLDAESIRDTLLFVAGNLDTRPGEAHPFPSPGTWEFTQHHPFKAQYDHSKRSVYLMTQRIQRVPFFASFDGADPSTSTAHRMVSTTPVQALYFLNDPFVYQQTEKIAERVREHAASDLDRIRFAYELLFAREPDEDELRVGLKYLAGWRSRHQGTEGSDPSVALDRDAWHSYIRSLIRLNEFVYLD
jgi:hypothetical protein